jgi:hypothetical protein
MILSEKMKYLGFDYLYNLDKDKVAKYIFYVIRDNQGNDLLSFNSPKYAKRGFTLLCDGMFRYLKGLLS